jgi:hypothetical protein
MKLLLAMSLLVGSLSGPGDPDPPSAAYDGSAGETDVSTPRVLTADVDVNGVLDEPAWAEAAVLQGFTQYDPSEGTPASQRTEVLVFTTSDAIYFGIRAFDTDPRRIRATLAQRDNATESDDWVRIILDTFDDQRRAYVFTVNPLGVQHDGLWIEGKSSRRGGFGDPIDDNPDFIWDSSGRLEDWGYAVEVRVPFKTMRFRRQSVQQWGVQVVRNIQRFGYKESWSPITANQANKLTQAGKLLELQDLNPGLFMEINPEVTGKRLGVEDSETGEFIHENAEGSFGLNFTYGVTPNLRFDATYNPDFSQVEADAGQIAVNERFAIFFPEKRPFFLEGTEIFNLPQQLVYTRTIVDPLGGAKLTGKVGGFDIGYLGAVDRLADVDDDDAGRNVFVNLVRARRDLGRASNLGLIYTDRTRSRDLYNRVGGADARIVFARRYTVELMGAGSITGDAPGSSLTGGLLMAKINRSGRNLSFGGGLEDTHPDFRASSGFLRRIGDTRLQGEVRYNWWGQPGALLERWGPTIELEGYWDHDAFWGGQGLKEGQLQARFSTSFRGNVSVWITGTREIFDYGAEKYDGLYVGNPDDPDGQARPFYPDQSLFKAMNGLRIFSFVGGIGAVRGRLGFTWKETPIFDRALRVPVEAANSFQGEIGATVYPTRSLSTELGFRYLQLDRQSDGSRYSTATIPRLRVQYQFTKAWYLRTILEYGSQEAADLRDPESGEPLYLCGDDDCDPRDGATDNELYGDVLLGYEPSPGTVFYVGYTRQMKETDAFRFRDINAVADGLFVKVSYRFRL